MLRLPLLLAAATAGLVVAAGLAHAQSTVPASQKKGSQIRSIGLLRTVQLPHVQTELNLSDEQKQRLNDLFKGEAGGNAGAGMGISSAMGGPGMEKMFQLSMLQNMLTQDQMKRLKEIDLQMQGTKALKNPEVIGTLGLTLEQQEKLNPLFKQADAKKQLISKGPNIGVIPGGKTLRQIEQELTEDALKVLTREQRQKFEKMKGKPVELTR
jgi:hypothetical protein